MFSCGCITTNHPDANTRCAAVKCPNRRAIPENRQMEESRNWNDMMWLWFGYILVTMQTHYLTSIGSPSLPSSTNCRSVDSMFHSANSNSNANISPRKYLSDYTYTIQNCNHLKIVVNADTSWKNERRKKNNNEKKHCQIINELILDVYLISDLSAIYNCIQVFLFSCIMKSSWSNGWPKVHHLFFLHLFIWMEVIVADAVATAAKAAKV